MTSKDAAKLLREAADIVEGARADDYGSFADNMQYASKYAKIDAYDVARALMGVKAARLQHQPDHHDSMVDFLGYAALTLTAYGEV